MNITPLLLIAWLSIMTSSVWANQADVIDVRVTKIDETHFKFDVTVKHADTGWEHYADRWEILGPDQKVITTRKLLHPHVDEQPFTRLLDKVAIPLGIKEVVVRAHDKQHGYGGKTLTVKIR